MELVDRLAESGVAVDLGVAAKLVQYLLLLVKWNRTYNLTAHRRLDELIDRHIADALLAWQGVLAFAPSAASERREVADIGCGAGLPGLVWAMMAPTWSFCLIDSNHKKAAFVRQATMELKLDHCRVLCERVDRLTPNQCGLPQGFDLLTCRAYAALADWVGESLPLLAANGRFCALKGHEPEAEIAALPPSVRHLTTQRLPAPATLGERCLVWLQRA